MANTKISALTAATTPLAGTEVLPIVQSSTTKQVSVANLTAGRAVSIGNLTYTGTLTGSTSAINIGSNQLIKDTSGNFALNYASANLTGAGNGLFLTIVGAGSTASAASARVELANSNTAADGNGCGEVLFENIGNNGGIRIAGIYGTTSGSGGASGFGGKLEFGTKKDNSGSSPTIAWTIDKAQDLTFNVGNLIQGTAAKGINFTANTAAAGKTSQLLNWYEEGTFTPTYYGSTTTGTTTYTLQSGTYTRIGNVLYYNIRIAWSNATGTGNGTIGGFPYNAQNAYHTAAVLPSDYTLTALNIMSARIGFGNTMTLFQTPVGGGTQTAVGMDTAAELTITGHYFI